MDRTERFDLTVRARLEGELGSRTALHGDTLTAAVDAAMVAVSSYLDWPCVHEEVATRGLTMRCLACNAEVPTVGASRGIDAHERDVPLQPTSTEIHNRSGRGHIHEPKETR